MGQNAGQTALTIVGAVVGAAVGYETGNPMLGFEVGLLVGGIAGQAAFPTQIHGPRLGDLRANASSPGSPIPKVYGSYRVAGQLIQALPVVETSNKSSGKGGPQLTSYSYTQTVAFSFAEAPEAGIVGFRRIWIDNKLVYDKTAGATTATLAASEVFDTKMAVYLGTADQLPDATLEAALGVGEVPAYRGQAYIVFENLNLTTYGNRIPNIAAEVITAGNVNIAQHIDDSNDVLFPWASGADPRACKNDHEYQYGTAGWKSTSTLALADAIADGKDGLRTQKYLGWSRDGITIYQADGSILPSELEVLYLHFNASDLSGAFYASLPPGGNACASLFAQGIAKGQTIWWSGLHSPNTRLSSGYYVLHDILAGPQVSPAETTPTDCTTYPTTNILRLKPYIAVNDFLGLTGGYNADYQTAALNWVKETSSGNPYHQYGEAVSNFVFDGSYSSLGSIGRWTFDWSKIDDFGPHSGSSYVLIFYDEYYPTLGISPDTIIQVRRKVRAPDNPCQPRCQEAYPLLPENPDYCVISGAVEKNLGYSKVMGSFKVLADYTTNGSPTSVTQYPLNPIVASGSADDNSTFWATSYAAAVAAGTIPSGWTYNAAGTGGANTYPKAKTYEWNREYDIDSIVANEIAVSEILSDACLAAGLTSAQIDVTALTKTLTGYVRSAVMSARDAITPLQAFAFFDCAETNGKIIFKLRGQAPVATLSIDDLGAAESISNNATSRMEISRTQSVELPAALRVTYADKDNAYQNGLQAAQQPDAGAVNVQDVSLSIAMDGNTAAQIADILLHAQWIGRESAPISLTAEHLNIQPADAIMLPFDGVSRRAVVKSVDYAFPGLLTLQVVRDEADVWTSYASGAVPLVTGQTVSVVGPTGLAILDLPALVASDNADAGFYAAVFGYLSGWPGAEILRSMDAGASFTSLFPAGVAAVIGQCTSALPNWVSNRIYDPASQVTIKMYHGTLSSTTLAALLNNANLMAIGADGRWEILQFLNATLNGDGTYTLSGFLRGLLGTDQYMGAHGVNDIAVLLSSTIYRVSNPLSFINISEQIIAATSGTPTQNAATVTEVPQAVCLKPLAPTCIGGGRDASGNVLIKWVRQDRFATDMIDYSDIPMSESSELYDLEVYASSAYAKVVRTISNLTIPAATYAAADQVTDFGAAQVAVYIKIYQRSNTVGRGYAATTVI